MAIIKSFEFGRIRGTYMEHGDNRDEPYVQFHVSLEFSKDQHWIKEECAVRQAIDTLLEEFQRSYAAKSPPSAN